MSAKEVKNDAERYILHVLPTRGKVIYIIIVSLGQMCNTGHVRNLVIWGRYGKQECQ